MQAALRDKLLQDHSVLAAFLTGLRMYLEDPTKVMALGFRLPLSLSRVNAVIQREHVVASCNGVMQQLRPLALLEVVDAFAQMSALVGGLAAVDLMSGCCRSSSCWCWSRPSRPQPCHSSQTRIRKQLGKQWSRAAASWTC